MVHCDGSKRLSRPGHLPPSRGGMLSSSEVLSCPGSSGYIMRRKAHNERVGVSPSGTLICGNASSPGGASFRGAGVMVLRTYDSLHAAPGLGLRVFV